MLFFVGDIEIASYAGDNSSYVSDKNIEEVIQSVEQTSKILFKWISDNLMKSNADKCHLPVGTFNKVNIRIDNFDISNSKCEKLSGVKFDHKTHHHISKLYKNASPKVYALARVTPYMNTVYQRGAFSCTHFLRHNLVIGL